MIFEVILRLRLYFTYAWRLIVITIRCWSSVCVIISASGEGISPCAAPIVGHHIREPMRHKWCEARTKWGCTVYVNRRGVTCIDTLITRIHQQTIHVTTSSSISTGAGVVDTNVEFNES